MERKRKFVQGNENFISINGINTYDLCNNSFVIVTNNLKEATRMKNCNTLLNHNDHSVRINDNGN